MYKIDMNDKKVRGTMRRLLACCGLIGEGRPDWLEVLNSHLVKHHGCLVDDGLLHFETRENFDEFIGYWSTRWQEVKLSTSSEDHGFMRKDRTEEIHKWLITNGLIRDRDWAHDNWSSVFWFESKTVATLFMLRWA